MVSQQGKVESFGMKKEIIINGAANETRIAITEDGRLAELFVENPHKERMIGDIYLGRVAKVMPGIKAAFIDLGLGQDGFLHFSDIGSRFEEYQTMLGDDEEEEEEKVVVEEGASVAAPPAVRPERPQRSTTSQGHPPAKEVHLEKGQEIIVQITKEPVGKKG